MKKILSLSLALILVVALCVPALAVSNNYEEANLREPLQSEINAGVLYDSCELDKGIMYLKETSEYRIVYIVFDEGYISYAICYKDNPKVSHTGYYYPSEQKQFSQTGTSVDYLAEPDAGSKSIVNVLLTLEPEKTIDFAARATPDVARIAAAQSNTITTEEEALEYAADYAPGWKTPVTSRLIGTSWAYPVTVNLYEHVNGYCTEESIVKYYAQDTLTSLASLIFKLNLTKIKNVVTNAFDGVSDYIAQVNGTLSYFEVDNTRTKTARIDGQTWYWAGWDRTYCVYSGDKATRVEQIWDLAHSDYDEGISYYAEKAYYNYTNQY